MFGHGFLGEKTPSLTDMQPGGLLCGSHGNHIFVNKFKLSSRLVRWTLWLEEFDYIVEYKPRRMHLQAGHLFILSQHVGASPVDDRLGDENLFMVTAQPKWYARVVKFLTTQQLLVEWLREKKHNVRVNRRHFVVVGNKLLM